MQVINKNKLIKLLQTTKREELEMKDFESILNIYGDTYYWILSKKGKGLERLTYKDLFDKFKKEYGAICDIDDYRPNGNNVIDVWLKNGNKIKATYNIEADSFKLSANIKDMETKR